jgi:DNA-binding response OmpR family regulator
MSESRHSKKRILCVDKDQDTCDMIALILGLENYQVDLAMSAKEGLEKAQQNRYDLMLIHLHFLNGSGEELCRQIRQFDRQTPILFYSGEAREKHIKKALEAGAQGYLVKPVDPTDLVKSIKHHTGGLAED